jgi:hypothetical protein
VASGSLRKHIATIMHELPSTNRRQWLIFSELTFTAIDQQLLRQHRLKHVGIFPLEKHGGDRTTANRERLEILRLTSKRPLTQGKLIEAYSEPKQLAGAKLIYFSESLARHFWKVC